MAIQQFDLLKKSAITQIQTDLEGAVEADRLLAQQAAVDSVDAKNLSQAAQGLSEDARDKSQQWAENPENVEVEPGKYSALHHAAKAEDSKNLAERWAEEEEDVPVDDGKYSAKHWAAKADEMVTGKEETANKQNSLAADGTGTKYPTVDAVNAALILKADSIDLIEAKQSISTLENVLSDANINQEARVTTSGVDTVLLPKTAANTGMQVQLFGASNETSNVLGTGRIRSVNSSGLNPSYLYFNGGQLRSNGLIKDEIRKGTNGYELVKRVGVGTLGANGISGGDFEGGLIGIKAEGNGSVSTWSLNTSNPISGTQDGRLIVATAPLSLARPTIQFSTGRLTGQYRRLSFDYKVNSGSPIFAGITTGASIILVNKSLSGSGKYELYYNCNGTQELILYFAKSGLYDLQLDNIKDELINTPDGGATGSTATVIGSNVHYTLATPVITPIPHAGLLNSNSNGTVYFEPIIADAGVYSSNLAIQLTDYPIASFESIRKYANGTYTDLNPATAVIASGGLSFTHPDLVSGDLVMFTYAYNKESIGRSMTLTHYDSRFVIADTANSKVYRWRIVSTNGVATIQLTEV